MTILWYANCKNKGKNISENLHKQLICSVFKPLYDDLGLS